MPRLRRRRPATCSAAHPPIRRLQALLRPVLLERQGELEVKVSLGGEIMKGEELAGGFAVSQW